MTFLEVVFATALFGLVAASILGVFSFTMNAVSREQKLLACSEVANRLIMAYMDDRTTMPDPSKTVEYGPEERPLKFRWEYREDPITLVEPKQDVRANQTDRPLRADRFRQVTVHVWLSEDSGGSRNPDDTTPQTTLTRMYDPLFLRNPDSFINMVMTPSSQARIISELQGNAPALGNAAAPSRNSNLPPAFPPPLSDALKPPFASKVTSLSGLERPQPFSLKVPTAHAG